MISPPCSSPSQAFDPLSSSTHQSTLHSLLKARLSVQSLSDSLSATTDISSPKTLRKGTGKKGFVIEQLKQRLFDCSVYISSPAPFLKRPAGDTVHLFADRPPSLARPAQFCHGDGAVHVSVLGWLGSRLPVYVFCTQLFGPVSAGLRSASHSKYNSQTENFSFVSILISTWRRWHLMKL